MSRKSPPVKKFRLGYVNVAVFENEGMGDNTFYTVKLQRTYKEDGEYRHTDNLSVGDLLNASKCLEMACEWIASQ